MVRPGGVLEVGQLVGLASGLHLVMHQNGGGKRLNLISNIKSINHTHTHCERKTLLGVVLYT